MKKGKLCTECGTPLFISSELKWGDNGVISLRRSPRNRMVLFESETIDNLFRGIEELIGVNIEHIVIESRRRDVRKYIEGSFPGWMRKYLLPLNERLGELFVLKHVVRAIRNSLGKTITGQVFDIGRVYGYGDVMLGPLWATKDIHPWRVNIMRNPHSVILFAAEALASVEAFENRDHWIVFWETAEDTYEYSAYPAEHPIELKERLQRRRYDFKPGDIEYERCGGCGLPLEIASLEWDLNEGTIHDPESGRRMALFGPFAMDAILYDLEAELGPSIPEVVVEAQRRYVKSRIADERWSRSEATFHRMTALRGLGMISDYRADEKNLRIRIQNSSMPLLVLGMARAIYETAMGAENSKFEWRLSEDGDFDFTIMI